MNSVTPLLDRELLEMRMGLDDTMECTSGLQQRLDMLETKLQKEISAALRADLNVCLAEFGKMITSALIQEFRKASENPFRHRFQQDLGAHADKFERHAEARQLQQAGSSTDDQNRALLVRNTENEAVDEQDLGQGVNGLMPEVPSKKARMMFNTDQDVDTTQIALRENQSIGNVFTIDTDLETVPYFVEDRYKDGWLKDFVAGSTFQNITLFMIVLNVVYLPFEQDLNDTGLLFSADVFFIAAENCFCCFFTAELTLRFCAFARKLDALRDGWFRFDLFLVVTMVAEIWIWMPYLALTVRSEDNDIIIPTQPLRIVRLAKVARMTRLIRAFPELVTMITSLGQAVRAIFSTLFLVVVMMYGFTNIIDLCMKDEKEFNRHLKESYAMSLDGFVNCMWTLLLAGTLMLDNTGPVMTELVFGDTWMQVIAGFLFLLYSGLTALLVLQMLIGVLCEVITDATHDRDRCEAISLMKQELLGELLSKDNGDGKISREELMSVLQSDSAKVVLKKLNINRPFLTSTADLMFHDESTLIPIRTILELIVMCKGENPATVEILASSLCFLSAEITELHDKLHDYFARMGVTDITPHQHFFRSDSSIEDLVANSSPMTDAHWRSLQQVEM